MYPLFGRTDIPSVPVASSCLWLRRYFYQFQDLFFSVILHIASQLTHRIRSGFAPAHRTGTHPVGIHMTHMTFCTASIDILILHSSHCAIPVVQQVFLTVIHCFFVRRTFPDSFYSLYKLFSSCPYTEPSTAVLWLPLPHPASGWPPC